MRYLILCMLLMFGGNLTGETVSAQSFAQIKQIISILKSAKKKGAIEHAVMQQRLQQRLRRDSVSGKSHAPQKESTYSYDIEQAIRLASMSGKNSTSKDTFNAKDSLDLVVKNLFLGDKSGQLMKSPTHKNSGLTSKDTIYVEDSQVSSIEVIDDVNASRPKMFWEQLQGYVR